jgi:anti-sigma regulatory factor (Ser/Thr protein kinase)
VLRAGGTVEPIGSHGTLLGIAPDPTLDDAEIELAPGDALMLYTDGLTDAYAPASIVSPADLAAALEPCQGMPAEEITRAVARTLLVDDGRQPRDDIALLVLRIPPLGAMPEREVVALLDVDVDSIRIARKTIEQLEPELGGELMANVSLLVSELVTNSVRHARTPASASIELRATLFADHLRVEVTDQGTGFEAKARTPVPGSRSGWGLYLVDELSDRWGVTRAEGTGAWFEIDLDR